jgi:pectinesterase
MKIVQNLIPSKCIAFFVCCSMSIILVSAQSAFPSEITVAKDGSGNYTTIQEAVNSVRDLNSHRVIIHIKKGLYLEKLIVPSWKTNISLIGQDKDSTIISCGDFSGKPNPGGSDLYGKDKFTTYTSYTVLIQGNDVSMEALTIQNTAGAVGQAVALHVEADRFAMKDCKLLGKQDTLYVTKENARQYFQDCFIEGTTDFIFGEATVLFQNCTIKSLSNSYVTAAATRKGQAFGFVLKDCNLIADTAAKKVYLGRPWRPYAKTVYINCNLGAHIVLLGWDPWRGDAMFPDKEKTAYYAEYGSKGFGAAEKAVGRVSWSKQLTNKELKLYTINNILGGADHWNPLAQLSSN